MTAAAVFSAVLAVFFAYGAWTEHRDATAERRRAARDLATIRRESDVLAELHRRVTVARAAQDTTPTDDIATQIEEWLGGRNDAR